MTLSITARFVGVIMPVVAVVVVKVSLAEFRLVDKTAPWFVRWVRITVRRRRGMSLRRIARPPSLSRASRIFVVRVHLGFFERWRNVSV